MRVKNKIALVTGGSSGLGEEIARVLHREGSKVILTDLDASRGNLVADEVGGKFYQHDVSRLNEWESIVSEIVSDNGRIDVLVNCAGIGGDVVKGGFNTTEDMWNKVLSVNLSGSFWACKTVAPTMIEAGSGSIILMSSIASYLSTPNLMAYGVSKSGVAHLAKSVALLGAENGARVRCNSVHPGIIKTNMLNATFDAIAKENGISVSEIEEAMCAAVPFGETGTPEDVANMVLFLASDESSYVTGSEFKVDGGWSMVDERP